MASDCGNRSSPVELVCVTEGKRLRVRIVTAGYFTYANCQFPRDIRIAGQRYRVPASSVHLVSSRGKYFYSISPKSSIEMVNSGLVSSPGTLQIYEDNDTSECAICMSESKEIVFVPCGHYYCCSSCSRGLSKCPICRGTITTAIRKTEMDT